MLSIVCVYNNKTILEECLIDSLNRQRYKEFQLVLIDNTQNTFKSMEAAFLHALSMVKGDYVAFSHQDIVFLSDDVLQHIVDEVGKIDNLGVAGVAGAPYSFKNALTVSNILQGKKKEKAARYDCDEFFECQTVDECFFVVPKQVLDEY